MNYICINDDKKLTLGEVYNIENSNNKSIVCNFDGEKIASIEKNIIAEYFLPTLYSPEKLIEDCIYIKYSTTFKMRQLKYTPIDNGEWYGKKTYAFLNIKTKEKVKLFKSELTLSKTINEAITIIKARLDCEFYERELEIKQRFINDCIGDLISNIDFCN